ncbi:MAG TPA: peptidylprolyl isomerase [Bacilli bacterium]|nr:peptidylprolyl isomerase [Bacilli bacterium]
MKNVIKKGIVGTLVLFMLTGCGGVPELKDGSDLLFTMDDINLTVDDFYEELKDNYGTYELINKIDEMLLNEVYETTDDMDEEITAQITTLQSQFGSDFEDAIYYYYGVSTEADLYDYIEMSYKRDLATQDYAETLITDEDIEDYYETTTIGDIKASHILITSNATDDMTDDEKAAAEEEAYNTAVEIIEKLDDGEDFATLAEEYSEDSSASDGGNLGYFNRGDMVEEFEDAAIALEVGEYTEEPVETEYGYHIILKTDQKDKPELEDVKDDIKDTLVSDLIDNTSNIQVYAMEWIREEHNLQIYDSELKIRYDHYMNEQKES